MPTDDERREVARRLRETGEELGSSALLWYHIAKILGVRTATDGRTACNMLADLIEPNQDKIGTCPENVLKASGVDRDALLALADEMEEFGNMPVKHPGIRVLQNDDFSRELGYARRIREALGVSDD